MAFELLPGDTPHPAMTLSTQYGGFHAKGSWVDLVPASWVPYVQLCRLSPPAGLFLIYFPPVFGVLHAAATHHRPLSEVLYACAVLLCASFFGNNAAHAWNDIVDAPIDARIERTRTRPIPRGTISPTSALLFALTQLLGLLATLHLFLPPQNNLNPNNVVATPLLAATPAILASVYYPYAKRHTHLPQVVLGFCLTWSTMVGGCAVGIAAPWRGASERWLLAGCILWVVIFDTVYAHQDVVDDVRVGVKSTAVLLRGGRARARAVLWLLLGAMVMALVQAGRCAAFGWPYYVLSVGGGVVSVGAMVARVDLQDPASCWSWFSKGFWLTGLVISGGLLVEYATVLCREW
ncbi:4-hydroxybenzoate polyprenyltransferase [Chaetomidium leptoderma]|uniref:4-hydroxybenzoate polyprenyltransferase n=1 Tax=Chaetomidium leptoderma TaxID=669021 RepID=A0AAN6VQE9_9PEZI|nr:4-hydroxybenzoate polyprenyltransferase [Chaetomidium leptoderma]